MTMAARSLELARLGGPSGSALTVAYAIAIIRALRTAWKAPSPRIGEYPVLYMTEWK